MKITFVCRDGTTYEGGPLSPEERMSLISFLYQFLSNKEVPPFAGITLHIEQQ